jgi:2-polyprenyl-3-methyl-5-hydroxy-6-metoxy-1,4-benzoquinol methylase
LGVASGGAGFEFHGVAEAFKAVDQAAFDPHAITIVEVGAPQILVEVGSGQATGIRRSDCVLDIGCGAGQTSRDAARAAVAGNVVGVDISEQLLECARERTAAEGLHNVTYELGDAQVHPFVPRQFE